MLSIVQTMTLCQIEGFDHLLQILSSNPSESHLINSTSSISSHSTFLDNSKTQNYSNTPVDRKMNGKWRAEIISRENMILATDHNL